MPKVNDRQIGGNHYKNGKVEHWDFIEANGLGYLEGCASKYVTRCRKKHASPVQDLEKALHYVEKLIELSLTEGRANQRFSLTGPDRHVRISVDDFAKANDLTPEEREIVAILVYWRDADYLKKAVKLIKGMLWVASASEKEAN